MLGKLRYATTEWILDPSRWPALRLQGHCDRQWDPEGLVRIFVSENVDIMTRPVQEVVEELFTLMEK